VASLEASLQEVTNAGATVAVVSFGSLQGAEGWLKDTNCNLEMFLDQDRSLYRALGLPRSVSKVWGMSTIHFYAGEVASGRSLPKSQEEEDDPLQMGGDFTLNRTGHLVLCHPSSNPRDRPSLEEILTAVRSCPKE